MIKLDTFSLTKTRLNIGFVKCGPNCVSYLNYLELPRW